MDILVTPGRRQRRPNFPIAFKRQLAQQASLPGVSVSQLAQEHGINANMLFKWRRNLAAGLLGLPQEAPVMLPVTLIKESGSAAPHLKHKHRSTPAPAPVANPGAGIIDIQFAQATVRCHGSVDLATLGALLRMLQP